MTSVHQDGIVNAAPFSFFNVFSEDPALVVLGLQHKPDRSAKDTTRNIAASGVFVVHLVEEALAQAMNVCAIDFPPGASEIAAAGLTLAAGVEIDVPRIVEAPFALECRRQVSLAFGPERELMIGEVLRLHARPGPVNAERMGVDPDLYRPVGRLFGDDYARQGDRFAMRKQSHAEWLANKPGA